MTCLTSLELKKALQSKGFEIYRTQGSRVLLAERVRDNLLMDGNVAAATGEELSIRFITRAQHSDHPTETEAQLLDRARQRARNAVERGYREVGCSVVPILDPGDGARTLDTWYEVTFARPVEDLDQLVAEARFALALDKVAVR
ncbi:MAG: hypothetical protein QM784_01000 [Polyangiaceae bacterium]